MTVMVLGAGGQLGQAMAARLSRDHAVIPATRADVDLTRHRDLRDFVLRHRPAAIVNCAAYNDVDAAEDQPHLALEVNAFAPRVLARAADELAAVLLHYSTDFVFSGTASQPYTEDDGPEPQSVYGQSKLVGEWLAADAAKHYVVRVESLFGGPRARSSVDRIISALREGKETAVFFDRVVSPSYVDDVVAAAQHLLRNGPPHGLYHCVNAGAATWLEVGREIARLLGRSDALLRPVSVHDVTLRARRPLYAALSSQKLAAAGYAMPSWQDALARYLASARTS